jgi:hypothetical protein
MPHLLGSEEGPPWQLQDLGVDDFELLVPGPQPEAVAAAHRDAHGPTSPSDIPSP